MKVLDDIFNIKMDGPTALTVGKFDGIHRGHNILTSKILSKKHDGLSAGIITFFNSPRLALNKDSSANLITNAEREFMLGESKLDFLVECSFDEKLMHTDAESFIKLLVDNLGMEYLVVGTDFRFGYKGLGNVELLKDLSKKFGFELEIIEKLKKESRDISSTYIREELVAGNIKNVNEMLGYEYFVWGEVVHGAHLGNKLGMPTINIMPPKEKLVPKFGVYLTYIDIDGRKYHGITNVGMKPTVSSSNAVGIETHILDYNGDLYGEKLKVTFLEFLRPEKKFDSIDSLKNQMLLDKKKARELFNR